MSIDLSKLWPATQEYHDYLAGPVHQYGELRESMKFAALARNAFDVMMRRQIYPQLFGSPGKWGVRVASCQHVSAADPFTALVEADKWITEQEKANA